jgi:hypothetical protein|eukprot:COSAG01_NODE_2112_length_8403_cov_15.894027_8_plen_281_part_00
MYALVCVRARAQGAVLARRVTSQDGSSDFFEIRFQTLANVTCGYRRRPIHFSRAANARNDTLIVLYGGLRAQSRIQELTGWPTVILHEWGWPQSCLAGAGVTSDRAVIRDNAASIRAVVSAARRGGFPRVAGHGCSVTGKYMMWAAVVGSNRADAADQALDTVYIDSGGMLAPASVQVVGPCGEPFAAMLGRRQTHGWLSPLAQRLSPATGWEYDTPDLLRAACHRTRFIFAVGSHDMWNNPSGQRYAVNLAGCGDRARLHIVEGTTQHCGFYAELFDGS